MRRLLKRLFRTLGLPLLIALAVCNGYVHQPRHWQQARAQQLPAPLANWIARAGNATADTTDALGLTGHDLTATLAVPLATNRLVCAGIPQRLPGCPAPDDLVVLSRPCFLVGYSPSLRHPLWVAYRTGPARRAVLPPRPAGFKPDPAAHNSPQHKDYARSGYDRGHMVPNLAIAKRYGAAAQGQTFLTSNICPQRPGLNQGPWRDLEFRISELWPDCYGEVWVIAGAIPAPNGKRLPSGIDVPSAFYQIVAAQTGKTIRVFAVYMPQSIRRRAFTRATLVSVDELENLTGFDFLAGLPDDTEKRLESDTPTRLWPTGFTGACKLLYERFRTYD
ncbi:MAG: DNA/RNA non-specific endonuclease [Kiritimatiellae bacterium]|nr:DNA/RNA non-specific endonuclease [Kiritimatiellia bacterium]